MSAASFALSGLPWNAKIHLSSLTIAVVGGILLAHLRLNKSLHEMSPGIRFSQQKLLRLGIVLYGFRLTIKDVVRVGPTVALIDLTVVTTILCIGWWVGTRFFKLDSDMALLISFGSGICGAAAVLAADRVMESESHKASMAVATVVLFGTVSMFLYPALYPVFGFSQSQFGVFAGSTIHEVAQVVAAGRAVSLKAADIAVITKMMRVLMLAPALAVLGVMRRTSDGGRRKSISFPWFVLGFGAIVVLQSFVQIGPGLRNAVLTIDTILLGSAMFALGLGTTWRHFKEAGMRPLTLGAVLFATLFVGGSALAGFFVSN